MQDTRRQFLRTSLLAVGLATTGGFAALLKSDAKSVKLTPVPGERYSPRLLSFMADARFATPADALKAIRSQRVRFALEAVA